MNLQVPLRDPVAHVTPQVPFWRLVRRWQAWRRPWEFRVAEPVRLDVHWWSGNHVALDLTVAAAPTIPTTIQSWGDADGAHTRIVVRPIRPGWLEVDAA